jgi:hypothetical protein
MLKKTIFLLIATLLLAATLFIVYSTAEKLNHKASARENLKSLSRLTLVDIDGTALRFSSQRKTILVFFNSECNNCQHEVDQIVENKILFEDSEIVLMSSESIAAIKNFAGRYDSRQIDDLHFTKIPEAQVEEVFENIAVPQIFIYGSDGNLLKHFTGETKIDAILSFL